MTDETNPLLADEAEEAENPRNSGHLRLFEA
jgi:hypothetical protein